MGYQQAFAVSAAGMDVERLRVDVATMNLANANVVSSSATGSYKPMRVIAQSTQPAQSFAARFDQWLQHTASVSVQTDNSPARRVSDPGHPLADAQGMVSYPAVDTTTEMMTLMNAMRAYEANVAALNISRTMAMKALDIGGSQ